MQINTTSKSAQPAHTNSKWADSPHTTSMSAKSAYTTSRWAKPALLPPNVLNYVILLPNEPNQLYYLQMSWTRLMTYMWATERNNLYVNYLAQEPKLSAMSAVNQGISLALQVGKHGSKACIVQFPCVLVFSNWIFVYRGFNSNCRGNTLPRWRILQI